MVKGPLHRPLEKKQNKKVQPSPRFFSPRVRRGLLDFMSVVSSLSCPSPTPPPAPPSPAQRAATSSVPCRASTASSHVQFSWLDLTASSHALFPARPFPIQGNQWTNKQSDEMPFGCFNPLTAPIPPKSSLSPKNTIWGWWRGMPSS